MANLRFGGWYRDSAKQNIDPALALAAAGGGAKAFSRLARIPLDIDDRNMAERELAIGEEANLIKKYVADQRVKGQGIAASGKVAAAQLGLKGHEAAAFARIYDADIKAANNIRTNNTNRDKMDYSIINETIKGANQKDVAKINKSAKSPTQEEYYYDDDGLKTKKVNRAYVPPVDFTIDALDEVAKKAKKKS